MCYSLEDKERGFTLVELLIGMLVGLIVLGALSSTFIIQSRSLDVQEQVAEMVQTARAAMDMISHEVRMAGYDPSPAIHTAIVGIPYDASKLAIFADLNADGETDGTTTDDDTNEEIEYEYDDGNDRITRDTGGGDQPFAENIQAFDFYYLDSSGADTNITANIRQIRLTITAKTSKPDPNYGVNWGYRTYTLTSVITPPNLELP